MYKCGGRKGKLCETVYFPRDNERESVVSDPGFCLKSFESTFRQPIKVVFFSHIRVAN